MALNKITVERNQRSLLDLVAQPGNGESDSLHCHVCADCKVKNPRWASHSLGIFICVNCASVHRKIGTHVTKVKSITLDSWTKEQVDVMKRMGNLNSNLIHNPNETRHPPPPNIMDGERDSEMEQYIRAKYEYKSFMDRSALVASKLGPSRSASSIPPRVPTQANVSTSGPSSKAPPARSNTAVPRPESARVAPARSMSQPQQPSQHAAPQTQTQGPTQPQQPQARQEVQAGGVWSDLISLQAPSVNSSLPLQIQASASPVPAPSPFQAYGQQQPQLYSPGFQPQMQMQMAAPTGMGMNYQAPGAGSPYFTSTQPQFTAAFASPGPPLYNPQPQPFAAQAQQPLFAGSPVLQGASPGFAFQASASAPAFGNQMMGPGQYGTPSPQPFASSSPQPQFMAMGPVGAPQGVGAGMGMGQWMGPGAGGPGAHMGMGYVPQQQQQQQQYQQQGQWGAV
ncbi:hypothetical protein GGX14DRAFT_371789 [Mycena pura]|uniref:Arf-GAP domain-containing protein n=1 Tax=Mycena pura TaxID=153505 RepID=A0AAD6V359_9AGAR|nr:hypothetical protein GGX14DRAFT_371789 [Mycena pura]